MADRRAALVELLDGIVDLPVENASVGDDDDGIADRRVVPRHLDRLVREPDDGVGLAAIRGVLDQIAFAHAVALHVGEQLPHYVELVIVRPEDTRTLVCEWVETAYKLVSQLARLAPRALQFRS